MSDQSVCAKALTREIHPLDSKQKNVWYLLEFHKFLYAEDFCIRVLSLQKGGIKGTIEFTLYLCHILMLCSCLWFYLVP